PPGLPNYWGYQPLSFFAPHPGYSSRSEPLGAVDDFRDMVKALHRAGIEVLLDVVYNHTAEGVESGPTICLRGLSNNNYYILANVKLIAEAWDAAGLYQIGSFVGDSWKEWNGKFRDDVRSFLKSDKGAARALAFRLLGSPDIYEREEREPEQSINFVTCHDGF